LQAAPQPLCCVQRAGLQQANGRRVPQKVATTEDRDDIPRKPIKEIRHNAHHSVVAAGRAKLKELLSA
jgi:hypothetical protein